MIRPQIGKLGVYLLIVVLTTRINAWLSGNVQFERKLVIRSGIWGGVRRLLFRGGEERKKTIILEEEQMRPLSLGEELSLLSLGYNRSQAENMDRNAARAQLQRVNLLDSDDPTDEQLWELALREVQAAQEFAKEAMPKPSVRRRINSVDEKEPETDKALQRSWPDLESFTNMLKKEAVFRLRLLGPAFAEPLKEEARWRREAYSAFLDLTDGVGLLPPNNETELFQPDPGLVAFNDKVHDVYDDLIRRRDQLQRTRAQFDDWERRAAQKRLLGGTEGTNIPNGSIYTVDPISSPQLTSSSSSMKYRLSLRPNRLLLRRLGGKEEEE